MNTQEAIEIVCVGREKLLTFEETHKVVECLREGEKYRLMWKEIEKFYKDAVLPLYTETFENIVNNVPLVGYKFYYYKTLETILNDVEQKYFPKETNEYKEGEE